MLRHKYRKHLQEAWLMAHFVTKAMHEVRFRIEGLAMSHHSTLSSNKIGASPAQFINNSQSRPR